jgi:hypothetical protein
MSEQQPGLAQPRGSVRADDVEVGEICLARPDRGPDLLVLVTEVHEDHVLGMLCDHDCEEATDTDSVLALITTGYPRRLLVHGDVAGRIFKRRLEASVGRVDPDLVKRIALRGRGLDFGSTDLGRGRVLAGESDPRWEWKLDKFRQLRRVQARASELGWEIRKLGEPDPRVH